MIVPLLSLLTLGQILDPPQPRPTPPAWTESLVIYEVAPRAFTSASPGNVGPTGSGSGTFEGLRNKLPYLSALGITGIWLAGSTLSLDPHFFNIWTSYGALRPDILDPTLGSEADFKWLITSAHALGIRIILDVTTHGVCANSSLITAHPSWFKGNGTIGTWRMIDFDYNKREFQEWWVQTFTRWIVEFDVDGYRLDCGIDAGHSAPYAVARELWDRVVNASARAGKLIVIIPERGPRYHFGQRDTRPSRDLAGEFTPTFGKDGGCFASVQISQHGFGGHSPPGNYYAIHGSRAVFGYNVLGYNIPVFMGGEEFDAGEVCLPKQSRGFYGFDTVCNSTTTEICHGPGGGLYGTMMNWTMNTTQRAMLADASRILAIRQAHSGILHTNRCTTRILSLNCTEGGSAWNSTCSYAPYARYDHGKEAIIVAASDDAQSGTTQVLDVAAQLHAMGMGAAESFMLEDLWNGQPPRKVAVGMLGALALPINPDRSAGGGLAVLRLTPHSRSSPHT